MKLVANSVTKTTTAHDFREKLFPLVKSEIQINSRFFFPPNPENPKSAKLNSVPREISCHMVNCERVCFSFNLSAFVSRFQQSRIRELREFFGQESHHPTKSESARTPVLLSSI